MSKIIDDIIASTGDNRSPDIVAFELGQRVEQEGRPDIFEQHPDFRDQYYALKRELRDGPLTTFGKGLKTGVLDQLPKMAFDLGQMAENAAATITPEFEIGGSGNPAQRARDAADWLGGQAKREEQESQDRADPFAVRKFEEVQTPADMANYGARVVGENLPQIGLSFIPGAAAGRVAQAAALARGLSAAEAAAAGLKAAQAAAYVSSAMQNTADIYDNLDPEAQRSGKGLGATVVGGAIAGALDSVAELPLMNRLFPALDKKLVPRVVSNVLNRGGVLGAVSNAATVAGAEGITETLQEAVSIASEEYANGREYPADAIRSRLLNAGVGGALLGAATGGASGLIPSEGGHGSEAASLRPELAEPIDVDLSVKPANPNPVPAAPAPADAGPIGGGPDLANAFVARPPAYNQAAATDLTGMEGGLPGRLSKLGSDHYHAQVDEMMAADEALTVAQKILGAPTDTPATELAGTPFEQPSQPAEAPEQQGPTQPLAHVLTERYEPSEFQTVANTRESIRTQAVAQAALNIPADDINPIHADGPFSPWWNAPSATQDRVEQVRRLVENRVADPVVAPVKPVEPKTFVTSKGSSYLVDDNGNTTRTKRSPGRGQGETDSASPAVFVNPKDADVIQDAGMAQNRIILTENGQQIRPEAGEDLRGRDIKVVGVDQNGKETFSVSAKTNPEVGLHPFEIEYQGDQKRTHLGNRITEVSGPLKETVSSHPPVETPPLISTVKYVDGNKPLPVKNAPINALIFTSDDGNNDAKIKAAAGSSVVSADEKGVRRAVLLLDNATGKVYSRLVWSQDANSKLPGKGIRIDDAQRKLYSGEPGYKKGGRGLDFEGGDESAPWSVLSKQQFNGQPRFDVLGYVHWDKPQTTASFNFANLQEMQDNPAMNRVLKRNFQPEPNKAAAVEASKKLQRGTAEGRLRTGFDKGNEVKPATGVTSISTPISDNSVVGDLLADEHADDPVASAAAGDLKSAMAALNELAKKDKYSPAVAKMAESILRENKNLTEAQIPMAVKTLTGILATPKMDDYMSRLTVRSGDSYVASAPQADSKFFQMVSALQASGVDVVAAQPRLIQAMTGEAKARGVTITKRDGQALIALAVNYHLGTITEDDKVLLYHEGAHPFIADLPEWQQQAYQASISQLPWQQQKWISTGLGRDARLIANTPAAELSVDQRSILERMTPEELQILRGTDPTVLAVERAVEHLATIGVDSTAARDVISQIIRFVKGVMLRMGIELQRMLKGDANLSQSLVRGYVENKWLQFINRDFAQSNSAIAVSLKEFMGAPRTETERLLVYDNINGSDDNYYYDPRNGQLKLAAPAEGTTQSVTDYIARIVRDKNLGAAISELTQRASVPIEVLNGMTNGVPFEQLSTSQQVQLINQAQKQIEAVPIERTKDGSLAAPNGEPSKLNEQQWRIARTPMFIQWFGDWRANPQQASKVLDPVTGEPRVMFHGTNDDFNTFEKGRDLGFHFGTPLEAQDILKGRQGIFKGEQTAGQNMIPAFLRITNPAMIEDGDWALPSAIDRLVRNGVLKESQRAAIDNTDTRDEHIAALQQAMIRNGFDGAIYANIGEGDGSQMTWIAFKPEQVKTAFNRTFTPSKQMQLTIRAAESIDPTTEANTQFAAINHVSSVVENIVNAPEIARTMPGRYAKGGQDAVEQMVFGIAKENLTAARKKALNAEMQGAKSFATNQPFAFDPETQINGLPQGQDGSSAQQKAMRDSLLQLQKMESKALARIEKMRARKTELDEIVKEGERDLTKAEQNELDRVNQDIPFFERTLSLKDVGLHPQILRMQGKLQVGLLFDVVAGAEYVVPPTPDANEDTILGSKAKVPANLYFETPARQAFSKDLGKMQQWLANDDNRKNGWLYETVGTQFRKLSEVNLKPSYDALSARFKKTAFDSISNMLRGIGTPQAKYLSSRFYSLENVIQRHTADMEVSGGKWSSLYDTTKRAIGFKGQDQEFRSQYYNRVMQLMSATPDGTPDPYNKVIDAFNAIRPGEFKITDAAKPAFRDLMRATVESEKSQGKIFTELGLKVQDEDLGKDAQGRMRQRGLIRQGVFTGRLSVSGALDTIWEEMKPVWTKTTTGPNLVTEAASLWKQDPSTFKTLSDMYFTSSVKKDFVEPLIFSNKQYFTSIKGADVGARTMVSQANVRDAWETSGGDIPAFIKEMNKVEGGNEATEADMASQVMRSFGNLYAKINSIANDRAQAKVNGIPVLPREMMNARTADDFPSEWVDYALYDQGSNRVALHSMALNNAFGRDGLTSGEFAQNMSSVSTELDAIRREYNKFRKEENLTPEQTKEKMGADRYRIALDAQDHQYLLNNINEKMRYLVNPISTQLGDLRLADEVLGLSALGTLQNVRSALVNTTDVFGALYRTKFSSTSLKAVKDAITYTAADGASALLEMFGVHTHFMADFARKNRDLGAKDPDNFLRWRDRMTDYGTGNSLSPGDDTQSWATRTQNAGILLARRAKALVNANPTEMIGELSNRAMKTNFIPNVPGDQALAPKLRLMGIFKASAMWLTNGAVYGQYNAYKDAVMRGIEFINKSNDPHSYAQRLLNGEMTLDPASLNYTRKLGVLNDKAAWDYLTDAISTKMNEGSIERMVASAWMRTQEDPNAPVITDEQFARIRSIALSDVQLNSSTTNLPADWRSNPLMRSLGVFLNWPYMAMVRFPSLFQNAQGKYTLEAAMDGALAMLIPIIPLTLAASMGVDWYDEYATGKKANLRDIGKDALVPGLAPFAYPMATLERLARYGTGGLASEIVNATLNFDDARGGLSADSRVFLLSQLQNFRYTVGNLWQTEHIDYKSVIRPMMQFMGGNGVLQYAQLANHALGLNNAESAINERISVANYLRAVGRDLDLSVLPSKQSGGGLPNKSTPFINQMELAAYQDDTAQFKGAFADAVRAYREEHPDAIDPAKEVIRSFQSRQPLKRVFRVAPDAQQYRQILDNLSDPGREAVSSSVKLFNKYLLKLGAKPFEPKPVGNAISNIQKRMQASGGNLAAAQLNAAQAAYSESFVD